MKYKIKSGVGFVISVDELGSPYTTSEEKEATVFDGFAAELAINYLETSGFDAQLIRVNYE